MHKTILGQRLQKACSSTGREMLPGHRLFVTLEPCTMCFGAASLLHVDEIVYGASSTKFGACGGMHALHRSSAANHVPRVQGGLLANESARILQHFFRLKRKQQPAQSLEQACHSDTESWQVSRGVSVHDKHFPSRAVGPAVIP